VVDTLAATDAGAREPPWGAPGDDARGQRRRRL